MLLLATSSAAFPPPRLVMARSIAMKAIISAARFLNFSSAFSRASAICSAASMWGLRSVSLSVLRTALLLLRGHVRPDLDPAREAPLVVAQQVDDDARDVPG